MLKHSVTVEAHPGRTGRRAPSWRYRLVNHSTGEELAMVRYLRAHDALQRWGYDHDQASLALSQAEARGTFTMPLDQPEPHPTTSVQATQTSRRRSSVTVIGAQLSDGVHVGGDVDLSVSVGGHRVRRQVPRAQDITPDDLGYITVEVGQLDPRSVTVVDRPGGIVEVEGMDHLARLDIAQAEALVAALSDRIAAARRGDR